MVSLRLRPNKTCVQRAMGRLLYWGLTKFSQPPYGTVLRVEVEDTAGQR